MTQGAVATTFAPYELQPSYNRYYVRVMMQLEVDLVQIFYRCCLPPGVGAFIDKFLRIEFKILFRFELNWIWKEEPVGSNGEIDLDNGKWRRTEQKLVASIGLGFRVRLARTHTHTF